ncbi:FAD-binding protein, partial [Klebsiella pneumoniae]
RKHGVNFQPPLSGALHVARTNAFFMGGGKALINAYYRSAQELGIEILYNTKIKDLKLNQGHFEAAIAEDGRVFKAKSCVLAAGGFESN